MAGSIEGLFWLRDATWHLSLVLARARLFGVSRLGIGVRVTRVRSLDPMNVGVQPGCS